MTHYSEEIHVQLYMPSQKNKVNPYAFRVEKTPICFQRGKNWLDLKYIVTNSSIYPVEVYEVVMKIKQDAQPNICMHMKNSPCNPKILFGVHIY